MTPLENTTSTIKGKHLSFKERCQIEAYKRLPKPLSNREIARLLQRVPQTINNEIKRGTTIQISRQTQNGKVYTYEHSVYLADVAQEKYDQARQHSHRPCLFSQNTAFIDYADEQMLVCHRSPDAIVGRAKETGRFPLDQIPCTTTLYNWIDRHYLRTRNVDLLEKVRRNTKSARCRQNQKVLGQSIEQRPVEIQTRKEFGHWEIDTVAGKRTHDDQALLTLTERKTRFELMIKVDNKSAKPVNDALGALQERMDNRFEQIFKTITADNGSEFADLVTELPKTTQVYYTHPFSSFERGTNEHHNRIIRRFIPKGSTIKEVSERTVARVNHWMNQLPRKLFGYQTAEERFLAELAAVVAS